MCYYSKAMRAGEFRDAKREGEDMRIVSDGGGHHMAQATSDNKIVCLLPGTQLHIENFQLNPNTMRSVIEDARRRGVDLNAMIGKQISTTFCEVGRGHYSADVIVVRNDLGITYRMHICHLNVGVTFYTGAKRPDVADKVGVNDPSIMLDHKPETAEEPSLARTIGRAIGVCSIRR